MSEFVNGNHDAFRRALCAAAEQVEPAGDGLQRIQARVRHRRPMPWPIAWVDVALTKLSLRVPDGVWSVWDRVAAQLQAAFERFLPAQARALSGRLRLGWVRPVAAMSVAVFIVAVVVSMAIEVPQVVYPQASVSPAGQRVGGAGHTTGSAPGQPATSGRGIKSSSGQQPTSGATNHTTCPSKHPTINPAPSSSNSGSPSQSTSPSPSSSTSPSQSVSPSPSTSISGTPGTGDSPQMGSAGDTSPSDSPSSASGRDRAAVTTGRVTAGHAKPIQHSTRKPAAKPSPTCSGKASISPTSTVNVSPDAVGQLLLLAGSPGLTPAEVGDRLY
jgi:hypothetical protein